MSRRDSSTSNQTMRTFSLQGKIFKNIDQCNYTSKPNSEFTMSDELQKIKNEYEMLERKNQEELEIIQRFGKSTFSEFQELQEFLKKSPKLPCSSEKSKINKSENTNVFQGYIEPKSGGESENRKLNQDILDEIVNCKNEEISFMKEKFLMFSKTYKIEAEKLAKQERQMKLERDELKKELEEAHKKNELQSCFVKELERNNNNLHSKLGQINNEIETEIKTILYEAQSEKKRYLGTLKKLIELFQLEKIRIKEAFSNLSTDVNIEKNQHFQDVEQLRQIIDQLKDEIDKWQQEKALMYSNSSNFEKNDEEKQLQILKEIDDHRKYAHELEMIIKNLGIDNENLEKENIQLKKRFDEELEQSIDDANDNQMQLREELNILKEKFKHFQDIEAKNECLMAENEALKSSLKNIDDKHVRRIRDLDANYIENHRIMSLQIEEQNIVIETLNNDLSHLKIFTKKLENDLTDKANEITNLEFDKSCLEVRKQELQTKLDKAQKLVDQKIRDNVDQTNYLKTQHENEIKKLKTEVSKLQKESKDFQTSMIEQETLYKILKVDFDECLLEKEDQLEKFKKEKTAMTEGFQEKIKQLNSQISELQANNLHYEEIEQDLHKQIQNLVHNMDQLNYDNQEEVDRLKQEVKTQIGQELEEVQKFRQELEDQIKLKERDNIRLKSELQFKTQRCNNLEEELKGLKNSNQDFNTLLEESRERYEEQIEQLKLSNERTLKRNKDEISKLLKEFEQQNLLCDHLDKRKKELERLNKSYTDNLEHVTKVYERELEDVRLDVQNTKTYYENKISHSKAEAIFEAKKYETRINELEQELKILKCEVDWLREVQME